MRLIGLTLLLALGGCDMGHLGSPVIWPEMLVGSGIENASYKARRRQVSGQVAVQYEAILADILAGGGPALTRTADLARVPPAQRPALIRIMQSDMDKFTPDTPEARTRLVVWFMVHGE